MAVFSIMNAFPSVTSLILIVSTLTLFIFYYMRRKYSYWERQGVPFAKPEMFFGNTKDMTLQRQPMAFVFQRIYNELEGHKFGGMYQLTKPSLMIRDPDLIKSILVKNFSHFHDRNTYLDEDLDPLSAHILNLTGQRWKNIRYKLTPTFSSGKLKLMQDLMTECIGELDTYLTTATGADSKTGEGVQNLRELMAKVTTDVIGSCAFGFRCNSIRDENSEFRRVGRQIFTFNYRVYIRTLLRIINHRLVSFFKVKALEPEIEEFFMSVIRDAVKYRETSAQKRNDFLQLVINIQAEEKKQLQNGHHQNTENHACATNETTNKPSELLFTDNVVAANSFIFFIAGFETTASTLSYVLYELTLNPDICEKMREEVETVKQAHDGNLDYDAMKKLVYMEAVISESLRKYPPAVVISRRCTEPFQMPDSSYVVKEGMNLLFPVYALHHNPEYFPDPEKFLPDRFSEENKQSIKPGTYLPFGDGPRICIGMRFAMFEMKSVLSYLVCKFTLHPCEQTVVPLKFDSKSALLTPERGIWVRFQQRQKI